MLLFVALALWNLEGCKNNLMSCAFAFHVATLSSFSVKEEIMKTLEEAWPLLFFFFFCNASQVCTLSHQSIFYSDAQYLNWTVRENFERNLNLRVFSALLRMQLASLLPWMGNKDDDLMCFCYYDNSNLQYFGPHVVWSLKAIHLFLFAQDKFFAQCFYLIKSTLKAHIQTPVRLNRQMQFGGQMTFIQKWMKNEKLHLHICCRERWHSSRDANVTPDTLSPYAWEKETTKQRWSQMTYAFALTIGAQNTMLILGFKRTKKMSLPTLRPIRASLLKWAQTFLSTF